MQRKDYLNQIGTKKTDLIFFFFHLPILYFISHIIKTLDNLIRKTGHAKQNLNKGFEFYSQSVSHFIGDQ